MDRRGFLRAAGVAAAFAAAGRWVDRGRPEPLRISTTTVSGQRLVTAHRDGRVRGPLTVFCHGRTLDERAMLAPEMADVVRTLTVDGHLLASSYMHGQNWGNRQAVDDLARTVDHVAGRWDITEVNLIGQSMGGLPSLVAIATDVVPARRWAGIAPVCSLTAAYGTPTFHAGITAAHDIDSPATFHQATAGADPLRDFAPYRFAGTDFRFYVSPDDTFVPASAHAAPMVSFLTRAPADVTTVTVSGVHASDDHYRYGDLARFLAS